MPPRPITLVFRVAAASMTDYCFGVRFENAATSFHPRTVINVVAANATIENVVTKTILSRDETRTQRNESRAESLETIKESIFPVGVCAVDAIIAR